MTDQGVVAVGCKVPDFRENLLFLYDFSTTTAASIGISTWLTCLNSIHIYISHLKNE